jgi:hypothetical protein
MPELLEDGFHVLFGGCLSALEFGKRTLKIGPFGFVKPIEAGMLALDFERRPDQSDLCFLRPASGPLKHKRDFVFGHVGRVAYPERRRELQ